jgi:hypothetical protein
MRNFEALTTRVENGMKYWTFRPEDMRNFLEGLPDDEEFIVVDQQGDMFTFKSVSQMRALLESSLQPALL